MSVAFPQQVAHAFLNIQPGSFAVVALRLGVPSLASLVPASNVCVADSPSFLEGSDGHVVVADAVRHSVAAVEVEQKF